VICKKEGWRGNKTINQMKDFRPGCRGRRCGERGGGIIVSHEMVEVADVEDTVKELGHAITRV
jgi:hypothetical protein